LTARPAPHKPRNPFLIGAKTYLRPIEDADAATYAPWLNDAEVRRGLIGPRQRPTTEASARAYLRWVDPRTTQVFAIVTRAAGEHVGNVALKDIEPADRRAGVYLFIGRKDRWGEGLATEALGLLCRHAFETLNLHKVWLGVQAANERAIRVYAKLGFKPEARLREEAFVQGRYEDELLMGLLRGELLAP
jgi:RimJ/RimL family protein N-acetyltransferase